MDGSRVVVNYGRYRIPIPWQVYEDGEYDPPLNELPTRKEYEGANAQRSQG